MQWYDLCITDDYIYICDLVCDHKQNGFSDLKDGISGVKTLIFTFKLQRMIVVTEQKKAFVIKGRRWKVKVTINVKTISPQ